MSQVQHRMPQLFRNPWSGVAVLGALLLSGALVMQAVAATLVVSTTTLPDGALTSSYSQTLAATGGSGSYTWSVIDGALPAGLSLTASSGLISGTPTVLSNSPLTVKVTDSDGNTASKALAIKVNPALSVATSALAAGVANSAYTAQTLAATGGSAPYTWTTTSGALPTGLTLSAAGAITGTPTVAGTANFTVQVTDSASHTATKALTIAVSSTGVLTIVTTSLPNAIQSVAYSQTVVPAGGTPGYTFSLNAGTLPAGLTLAPATGAITGTPTATGISNFTIRVTDGAAVTDDQALSITVNAAVSISTASPLPTATAGVGSVNLIEATGGTAPYTWSITSGALPGGLALSASAGVISGAPTAAGTFNFTLQASDVNAALATKAFSITVNAAPAPVITTTSLPNAVANNSYTYVLQRTGGVSPFTWSVSSGALPAWLTLDASSGLLTGTAPASAAAAVNFTVQVVGSGGSGSDTQDLSITVGSAGSLNITTTSLPNGTQSTSYSQALSRTGGTAPFTWTLVSGSLPSGLSLSTDGVISGTPSTLQTSSFTVRVTDNAAAIDEQALSITIGSTSGLIITTTSLPNAKQNTAYSQTLLRTGGTSPFTWTLVSGSLPSGLSLSTAGVISGTPTTLQTSTFTVRVTDNVAAIDDQALSLTVDTTGGNVINTGEDFSGPCRAIQNSNSSGKSGSFKRLLEASGTLAQVKAFCDANVGQNDEFRAMCNRLFSVSNTWRSKGGTDSSFRRLIEAAGAAENVRSFCQSHFGTFTGHECDDDDDRDERSSNISSKSNNNGKKGKH